MLKAKNLIDGVNDIPVLADTVIVNKGDLVCKGIDFGGKNVIFNDVYYSASDKPSIEYLRNGKVLNEDCSSLFVNQSKLEEFDMDLSSVSAISNMFNSCRALSAVNITSCQNVLSANGAFYNCSNLKDINLQHLDSLKNASYMFNNCGLLNIELGPTENLEKVDCMFYSNLKLKTVKVSSLPLVTNMNNMFSLCWSLDDVKMPDMPELITLGNCFGVQTLPHHIKFGNCPKLTAITNMSDMNGFYDSHHDNMSVEFGDLDVCSNFSGVSKFVLCNTKLGVLGAENLDNAFSGTKSSTIHISGMPNATSAKNMFAASTNTFDGWYTREIEIGPAPKITDLDGWFKNRVSFALDNPHRETEYWNSGLLSFKYEDLSSVTALTRTFESSTLDSYIYNTDFHDLIRQAKSMSYTFNNAYIPNGLANDLFENIEDLDHTFYNAHGVSSIEFPPMPNLTSATQAFSRMYLTEVVYNEMPKLSATYEDLIPTASTPTKVVLPNFYPTSSWPTSYNNSVNKLSAITHLEFHDLKDETLNLSLCNGLKYLYVEKAKQIHLPSGTSNKFDIEAGEIEDLVFEGTVTAKINKLTGDMFGYYGGGKYGNLEIEDATTVKNINLNCVGWGSAQKGYSMKVSELPEAQIFHFRGWSHLDIPNEYPSVSALNSGFVSCEFYDKPVMELNFPSLTSTTDLIAGTSGNNLVINAPNLLTLNCNYSNVYQKITLNIPNAETVNIAQFNVRELYGSLQKATVFYRSSYTIFMDVDLPLQTPALYASSSLSGVNLTCLGPESWVKLALRNTESADTVLYAQSDYWNLTTYTDISRYINLLYSRGYKLSGYTATSDMPEYSQYFGNTTVVHDTTDHDSLTCCTVYYSGATNLVDVTSDFSNTKCTALMFAGCSALTGFVHDLSSVKYAGKMFEGCTSLKTFSADMPSLISGCGMFDGCENLEYIHIGSITSVPTGLFDGFNPTGDVVIELPNVTGGVPSVFKDPTLDMHKIHLVLPNTTNIDNSFSGQPSLLSCEIDSPVLESASGTFSGCSEFTGFTSNSEVLSSVSKCFYGTNISSLDDVDINWQSVKNASYAFSNTPLEEVNLDMSNMTNASYMFQYCPNLKDIEVTLPTSGLSYPLIGTTAATAVTIHGASGIGSNIGLYQEVNELNLPDAKSASSCIQLQRSKDEQMLIYAPKLEYAYKFIYGLDYTSYGVSVSGSFPSLTEANNMFYTLQLHDSYLDMPLVTAVPFNSYSATNITGRFDSIEVLNGTMKRYEPSSGYSFDLYLPSVTAAHNVLSSLTSDASSVVMKCPNLKDASKMFYQATIKPQLLNIDFKSVENASEMFSNGFVYSFPFKDGDLSAATDISKMFYQTGYMKRAEYSFPSALNANEMFYHNNTIQYVSLDLPVCTSATNMFYGSGTGLTYLGLSADSLVNFNAAMGIWSGNSALTTIDLSLNSASALNSTFVNLSGGLSSLTLHQASACSGMNSTVKGCTKLKNLSLPDSMPNLVSINGMAQGCTALSAISMDNNSFSSVVSASSAFMSCQNLTYFEAYMPNLSAASQMFSGCRFTEGLKLYAPLVPLKSLCLSGYQNTIMDCTLGGSDYSNAFGSGYTSSGIKSFKGHYPNVTRANDMFTRCSSLHTYSAETPLLTAATNIFSGCTSLTTVWGTFDNLATMPSFSGYNEFKNLSSFTSNIKAATNVNGMFYYKGKLESVSGNWESVTAASGTFYMCSALTKNNIQVSMPNLQMANSLFAYCHGITSFDANYPMVTSAENIFCGCSGLTSATVNMPSLQNGDGLFQNCKNIQKVSGNLSGVTSLSYTFAGCSSLTSLDIILPVNSAITIQLSACPLTVESVSGMAKNCVPVESGCTVNFSQETKDLSASTKITKYFDQLISKGYTVSGYTPA